MKKLLVVVDYQKDFINGALGFPGAELLDAAIAKKVAAYHKEKDAAVIYTQDTHGKTYAKTQEGRKLGGLRPHRRSLRCPGPGDRKAHLRFD